MAQTEVQAPSAKSLICCSMSPLSKFMYNNGINSAEAANSKCQSFFSTCVYLCAFMLGGFKLWNIWNILPLTGNFHDSYQSASNIPETRDLVRQFHGLCEAVSCQEPRAACHCNTASAGLSAFACKNISTREGC